MKLCCFSFLWERETLPNKRRFSKTALASSFTFDNLESAPQLRPQKVPWPIRFGNLLKRKVKVPTKRLIQRYLLMHRLYRLRFGKPFIINYDGTVRFGIEASRTFQGTFWCIDCADFASVFAINYDGTVRSSSRDHLMHRLWGRL